MKKYIPPVFFIKNNCKIKEIERLPKVWRKRGGQNPDMSMISIMMRMIRRPSFQILLSDYWRL